MQVEEPSADLATCFDQQAPRLRSTNPVDIDRTARLEGLEGTMRRAGEYSVRRPDFVSKCCETALEVTDVVAPRPVAEGTNYRNSPISSRRAPLGFAPTRRLAGSPSLKRMSVGMLMTSNRRAMSGLSSTLTFAIRMFSCSPADQR